MVETGLNVLVGLASTIYSMFDKNKYNKLYVKQDFYKSMLILIYKTKRFCNRPYFTGTKTNIKSNGLVSSKHLINKNWQEDILYLEKLLDAINMFYSIYKICVDKIEANHYLSNNVFNTCSSLLNDKKNNRFLEPMGFRFKFKKKINYIEKAQNEFRKRVL
jgi:hypothetical protein